MKVALMVSRVVLAAALLGVGLQTLLSMAWPSGALLTLLGLVLLGGIALDWREFLRAG